MTDKEIDMILAKTMYVFNSKEAIEIYVHVQTYRRALMNGKKITFLDALEEYITNIYIPIITYIKNDRKLKRLVKKYGLSYSYLIITDCLLSSKKLTLDEINQRVSYRTEDLKKKIAA